MDHDDRQLQVGDLVVLHRPYNFDEDYLIPGTQGILKSVCPLIVLVEWLDIDIRDLDNSLWVDRTTIRVVS